MNMKNGALFALAFLTILSFQTAVSSLLVINNKTGQDVTAHVRYGKNGEYNKNVVIKGNQWALVNSMVRFSSMPFYSIQWYNKNGEWLMAIPSYSSMIKGDLVLMPQGKVQLDFGATSAMNKKRVVQGVKMPGNSIILGDEAYEE